MSKQLNIGTMVAVMMAILSMSAAAKPNVVLIMADDVSWEAFGCYGAEDYKTPHIDALAAKGVQFKHCYSTPICTPSRVMIMSGQYNFRNYTHFGYMNPKDKTFANLMQDAGYKTAIAGKWQLNGLYNASLFPDSRDNTRPNKAGFDEYCLWQLTKTKREGGERFWSPALETNGKLISQKDNEGKYGPDIMSDFLCDFMERHKNEPFFIYYPTVLVHDPFLPTPDTIGNISPSTFKKTKRTKTDNKKNFVAMVSYLDKLVGKIVKKIEAIGQLDNTIIIFTADNGTHSQITSTWHGQEIIGGKAGTTDMGTHVPLVVYWKGKTAVGKELNDLVDFTDFYPTLAELAGVTLGQGDPIDGRSFLPQALGKPGNPRDWVLCHYQPFWGPPFKPAMFVRNANYKLYGDGRFFKPSDDLKEANNLDGKITNENMIKIHKQLDALLEKCPPLTKGVKSKSTKPRPLYPDIELRD